MARWVPLLMIAGTVAGSGELGVNDNAVGALIGVGTGSALAVAVRADNLRGRA